MDKLEDLIVAHPAIFRGAPPIVMSHLPAGWHGLVDQLCNDIERLLGPEPERFQIQQLKEKFGTLRFYWSLDDAEDKVVDFVGSDGGHAGKIVVEAEGHGLLDAIRALVQRTEGRSKTTCEECGSVGTLATRGGWASTLCDEHAAARERKSKR